MRALAQYVMRGRTQAMLVTIISAGTVMFYWIGGAALALVTLRQGAKDGFLLLLWALLPALMVAWYAGETAPMVVLLGSWMAAIILRETSSWPLALTGITAFGLITAITVLFIGPQWLDNVAEVAEQFIEQLNQQVQAGESTAGVIIPPTVMQIVGMLGLVYTITTVVCVVLGRSWQAALYNPGGFGVEFRQVRLPPTLAVPLFLVVMACMVQGGDLLPWAYLLAVPFIISGIALVHALVAAKARSSASLWLFYGLLILVNPVKDILILAALLDSFFDLRSKLIKQQKDS
ncbi:MAG: hypothetical protein ACI90U_000836 [Pseudomonadales bacterium]|jgi:hypothetical protein